MNVKRLKKLLEPYDDDDASAEWLLIMGRH